MSILNSIPIRTSTSSFAFKGIRVFVFESIALSRSRQAHEIEDAPKLLGEVGRKVVCATMSEKRGRGQGVTLLDEAGNTAA